MMTRYCNQAKQAYYLNLLYQRSTYNKLHRNVNEILFLVILLLNSFREW